MINLALKTEYSFKQCFGHLEELVNDCNETVLGIADIDNTFGHIQFSKLCKKANIKPIFGVRLRVVPTDSKIRSSQNYWIFIAKNNDGLKEIYRLVNKAYDQFYFFPRLFLSDIPKISQNVYIISPLFMNPLLPEEINAIRRINYKMITPYDFQGIGDPQGIAIQDNFYPKENDAEIYELLAGAYKSGDEYIHQFEQRVVPMHIVDSSCFNQKQWYNTYIVAEGCNAEIEKATMVKFKGSKNIEELCMEGIDRLKLHMPMVYMVRLKRELKLIAEKGYEDYFLIVADMLEYANKYMLVGPSRGSSAGSLVCYLLNITKIDPLKFDLIFERFIDVNRMDLPDIDIDFPDNKRGMVIDYLHEKYGTDNVKSLANINRLKAKSAIDLFGMGLQVPKKDCEEVKNAMIERSSGDIRSSMCILDTFNDTEPGRRFIEKYPKMKLTARIENHAQHAGKHAAGVIVSSKPLTNYGGINSRDDIIMMDKKAAEHIGLLKIDCLGLRTLSILEDAAELCGMHKDDYYKLPLDDASTIKIFKDCRLNGIFQFDGRALKMLTKSSEIKEFEDIVAITALARPGALGSGGAISYIKCKNGEIEPTYFGKKHKEITKSTYGIMVYQEQMMRLAKELANFTWNEIADLRMAVARSLGDSYFGKYADKFISGCVEYSNMTEEDAKLVWKNIEHAGSWIFNRSHAVSYALISYFTAYMKAHHPIEFLAASLNHPVDEDSAIKILRDGVENDGIKYIPVDSDISQPGWTVKHGVLYGGLMNIKGIGEKKAKAIMKARAGKGKFTPSMIKMLENPKTAFDILFPTKHYWGHFFDNPIDNGLAESPTEIRDIKEPGSYTIIGKLVKKNLVDLNSYTKVQERGHELIENTLYINIVLEDDHDMIMCSIGRYKYEELKGSEILEQAKEGEDWFLVKGVMSGSWKGLNVKGILNLTNWKKENESNV